MLRDLLVLGVLTFLCVAGSALAASPPGASSADSPEAGQPDAPRDPKFKVRARMTADHLVLSPRKVRCELEPVASADEKPATLASLLETLPSGKKLYVVLRDFRTNTQPGVLYNAYLNLPEKAPPELAREHAIGVVNFFNATIAADPTQATKSARFVSFDVTKLARNLASKGRLGDKAVVTLVPAGVPAADSTPVIGEVSLVEQ
jgi:hypothetical protein